MSSKKDILANKSLIEEILPLHIEFYFSKSKKSLDFWKDLTSASDLYVFGGFIVDFLKSKGQHRDIDIVVDHFNTKTINLITKLEGVKNSFGGYKLDIDGVKVDIWEIRKTWAIWKMNYLNLDLFSILPSTSFFNSTAIIFSVKRNKLTYHSSFEKYINNNVLEVLFEENPYPELCILKSYHSYLNGATLSNQLKKYIRNNYTKVDGLFCSIQSKHYNEIKYTKEELDCWFYEIVDPKPEGGEPTENNESRLELQKKAKKDSQNPQQQQLAISF